MAKTLWTGCFRRFQRFAITVSRTDRVSARPNATIACELARGDISGTGMMTIGSTARSCRSDCRHDRRRLWRRAAWARLVSSIAHVGRRGFGKTVTLSGLRDRVSITTSRSGLAHPSVNSKAARNWRLFTTWAVRSFWTRRMHRCRRSDSWVKHKFSTKCGAGVARNGCGRDRGGP